MKRYILVEVDDPLDDGKSDDTPEEEARLWGLSIKWACANAGWWPKSLTFRAADITVHVQKAAESVDVEWLTMALRELS